MTSTDRLAKDAAIDDIGGISQLCWKCHGKRFKYQKSTRKYDGPTCKVCSGRGYREKSERSKDLSKQPGKIIVLRGYPIDSPFRRIFPDGFARPLSYWGRRICEKSFENERNNTNNKDGDTAQKNEVYNNYRSSSILPDCLKPQPGEIVGSLGCSDWRIYQIADGNKLTVDDFICAYVAAKELRKLGYGYDIHKNNPFVCRYDNDDKKDNVGDGIRMFGGCDSDDTKGTTGGNNTLASKSFNHADLGTGCGSVLMMISFAFMGAVRSIGVEAQEVSYNCLRRGVEWNLGSDGTHPDDTVQIVCEDMRTWSKSSSAKNKKYRLITGTPPYFPIQNFVASQNNSQKVRCRIPTRGSASDYVEAASRLLIPPSSSDDNDDGGVFCMVEAAFYKAEQAVLDAVAKFNMKVQRRIDVVTRVGLPTRFSCWVLTKRKSLSSDQGCVPEKNAKASVVREDSGMLKYDFPIEMFALRNSDLTRTEQYTHALEVMGWVDFEKNKSQQICV